MTGEESLRPQSLLLTFLGIGVIANVIIIYAVAQVLAERRQNQQRRQPEE